MLSKPVDDVVPAPRSDHVPPAGCDREGCSDDGC